MKQVILSTLLLASTASSSYATMSTEELTQHKAAMKDQGISTMKQLCEYAGKETMTGGQWDGKTCSFPPMYSYNKYRQKFEDLKPLLNEVKPSFDL